MKRYGLIGLLGLLLAVTAWAAVINVPEAPARMTAVVVGGGGGAVAGPTETFADTFTTGSDQAVHTYNADWTASDDPNDIVVVAATDNLKVPGWYYAKVYHSSSVNANTYTQADVTCGSVDATDYGGIMARYNSTATTGYWLVIRPGSPGSLTLYRVVTTTPTSIGTPYSTTISSSTAYTLRLTVDGTGATVTVKGYLNGTERISYDDTDANRVTAAGLGGVIGEANTGGGDIFFDNYSEGNL